jgi:hypothetical protein
MFFNKDIEMSYDMLYRQEKSVSIELPQTNSKMYSRLCPWLLTWSDFGDVYEEDDDGYDDACAN